MAKIDRVLASWDPSMDDDVVPEPIEHPEIASQEVTCLGVPEVHEGVLNSGLLFFFRYRHGTASLGVGRTEDQALWGRESDGSGAAMDVGDPLQGVFSDSNQRNQTFADLLDRIYH